MHVLMIAYLMLGYASWSLVFLATRPTVKGWAIAVVLHLLFLATAWYTINPEHAPERGEPELRPPDYRALVGLLGAYVAGAVGAWAG